MSVHPYTLVGTVMQWGVAVQVHEGQGVLVDPQRDIDRFLDAAAERDVALRFVLDTHLHNDYVSGAEQAARTTGAQLVLPPAAAPAYPSTPAFHLEDIPGGALTIRPIHTPGHTPEHTSYPVLVDGEPTALFSGGSLLVASAGRPDLLGQERARTMGCNTSRCIGSPSSRSLWSCSPPTARGRSARRPARGATPRRSDRSARTNPLLAIPTVEEFVEQLLGSAMPIPAFYKFLGPTTTLGVTAMPDRDLPLLSVDDIADRPDGTRVVDVRTRAEQAAAIPGDRGRHRLRELGGLVGAA